MPVKAADPDATRLDAAFAEAMGAAPKPREPKAPPEVDHEAPHGRDEAGKPLAPHGYTREGKVRRTTAGRKPNEDQARIAPAGTQPGAGPEQGKAPGKAAPGQHAKALADTADGVWFALSALGKAAPGLPVIGPKLPAAKIQAQAAVWFATKDRMVAAVSLAAEHNSAAAKFAAKCGGEDLTWMITCVSLVAPVLSLSAMVWARDADAQLKEAGQPTLAELAERNDAAMDAAIAQLTAQMAEAAEHQLASANGSQAGA